MRLVFPYLFAISYSHSSNQSKRDSIGEDIGILSKFMDKVDGVVNETVDEPFHKDLDAFVDGMQDLSITTYTTTNRIGATSTQTVYNSYSYGQTTTIEVPKKEANMEDLLGGDNFYGNQLTDMYNEWKLANPDEEVSKSDFIVGSVHTRAFEYKSIKDEQQEKEFWVNIVSAVVIIGVGIFCPPAGLALGFAMGALEMSSAISGKDWVSGRELDAGERILRGGLSLLDIVPGVKALSSGARAVTSSTRLAGLADNVFTSGMKTATSKIDDVIRIGKSEVASRLGNLKTAANDAIQSAGKRLTTSIDEASEAVARFSDNISNALPKRQLAMEGAGVLPAGNKAATSLSKASDEVRAVLSKIDTSLGGGIRSGDDIIKEGSKLADDLPSLPSTYEERLSQTPVNNGEWTGTRGDSKFISELDEVNTVLKESGVDGIEYSEAIPDFSPVSIGEVEISGMTTDRRINFREADELLAEKLGVSRKDIVKLRKENKLTWHELNDMKTMQLVPTIINSKFGHLGGVAEIKKLLSMLGE
ncbi:HNH endonuclease [Listeria sp. ILCC797]|uniref:HNH endonuclease n=1 Tax=Listeria sp. ILCC797 TaxID=1918333 RepID=UPI0013565633|nr:HNH endonuclease [Listeria sp. ILCC797]